MTGDHGYGDHYDHHDDLLGDAEPAQPGDHDLEAYGDPLDPGLAEDSGPDPHRVASDTHVAEPDADEHTADLQDVRFGTSWTVPGQTESGHDVEWSTSYNGYYDQTTGGRVEPR